MDDHDSGRDERESTRRGDANRGSASADCSCCSTGTQDFEYFVSKVRLESEARLLDPAGEEEVLEAELPTELQATLGEFLGGASVRTLGDWVGEIRARTGGGAIAIDDLCHEDGETGHWGDLDGERYHFTCFFDAVVLGALADTHVDLRTESPDGTVIEATVTGDGDLTVDPEGTLVSFGVLTAESVMPDGEPTREDVYAAVCPVVKAFPTPAAYEKWSETVPAATVAIPLADATAVATAVAK